MVFVLSKNKKPLMPCTEKRARLLLTKKKAVIHKMYPFTIRLKNRVHGELQPVRLKFDPGSKTSGIAIESKGKVLWLGNLNHKTTIKQTMRTVRAVPVRVLLSAARGDRVEPSSYEPDR